MRKRNANSLLLRTSIQLLQKNKKNNTNSDNLSKWTTIISCLTGIISLIIALISAYYSYKAIQISTEHNKKSIQPLLVLYPKGEKDTQTYGIYLSNNGLGPARITGIKLNGKSYSKILNEQWLELFYEAQLTNPVSPKQSALKLTEKNSCKQLFHTILQSNINSIKQSRSSELTKWQEINQLVNFKNFFIKSCENPTAAQNALSFWQCLKTGSIEKNSIIAKDTETILEVQHIKLDDKKCTTEMVSFSKWLILNKFTIEYESPLYEDSFLKGIAEIRKF